MCIHLVHTCVQWHTQVHTHTQWHAQGHTHIHSAPNSTTKQTNKIVDRYSTPLNTISTCTTVINTAQTTVYFTRATIAKKKYGYSSILYVVSTFHLLLLCASTWGVEFVYVVQKLRWSQCVHRKMAACRKQWRENLVMWIWLQIEQRYFIQCTALKWLQFQTC